MIGHHLSEVVGPAAYSGYQPLEARVFAGEALRLEGWVEYPGRGLRYMRETFIPTAGSRAGSRSWPSSAATTPI